MLQNCVKYYITHSDDPVSGLSFTLTPETLRGLLVTVTVCTPDDTVCK